MCTHGVVLWSFRLVLLVSYGNWAEFTCLNPAHGPLPLHLSLALPAWKLSTGQRIPGTDSELTPGQDWGVTCRPLPPVPEVAPCQTAMEGFLTMEVGRDTQGLLRFVNWPWVYRQSTVWLQEDVSFLLDFASITCVTLKCYFSESQFLSLGSGHKINEGSLG